MNTPTRLILKLLLVLVSIGTLEAKDQKPNIVLLYIDDWAWNGSSVAMHPDMPNSKMPVVRCPTSIAWLAREWYFKTPMDHRNAPLQEPASLRARLLLETVSRST